MILTVHTLAELRIGDRIRTVGPSITYNPPAHRRRAAGTNRARQPRRGGCGWSTPTARAA